MTSHSLSHAGSGASDRTRVESVAPARGDRFLAFLAFVLAGYAIGDKGFAYIGVPPLYIGEFSLLFGIGVAVMNRNVWALMRAPVTQMLVVFIAWNAMRTAPYVGAYGIEALRDAVLWGYAAFAIVVGGLLVSNPARLSVLVDRYRRFVPVFLILMPVVWVAASIVQDSPRWPWSGTPILFAKGNDFLAHLGGVTAFVACGLWGRTKPWMSALLTLDVIMTGYVTRGGLLAWAAAFALCGVVRPRNRVAWHVLAFVVGAVGLLAVTGARIKLGEYREISVEQFAEHIKSTAGESGDVDLENTKVWRVAWWATIVDYTVLGEYFWKGKGYGINLADDDGFQVTDDGSLRSPHSVHMTFLARTGVPGLLLWLALQFTWAGTLALSFLRSRRAGDEDWSQLFIFLLAYWMAMLIAATFDVYLEGPMGGVWFWVVFGIGIGASEVYRQQRTALVHLDSRGY